MSHKSKQQKVIIIGAGMSGLGAAIKLLENGYPCVILESQAEAGGLAGSFSIRTHLKNSFGRDTGQFRAALDNFCVNWARFLIEYKNPKKGPHILFPIKMPYINLLIV